MQTIPSHECMPGGSQSVPMRRDSYMYIGPNNVSANLHTTISVGGTLMQSIIIVHSIVCTVISDSVKVQCHGNASLHVYSQDIYIIIVISRIIIIHNTFTRASIGSQSISSITTAGVGSNGVSANLRTTVSVGSTLINL